MLEELESRQLLSTTVYVGNGGVTAYIDNAGALHVNGTGGDDYINVVEENGKIFDLTVGAANGDQEEIDSLLGSSVNGVIIDAKSGNDAVNFDGNTVDGIVLGGNGNDTIFVNDFGSGTSIVDGQNGDDNLTVGAGHNTFLVGGNGNDVLAGATASGNVLIFGGNGNDTIALIGTQSFADGGNGNDTAVVIGNTLGTFRIEHVQQV